MTVQNLIYPHIWKKGPFLIYLGEIRALHLNGNTDELPAEGVLARRVKHLLFDLGFLRNPIILYNMIYISWIS